MAGHVLPRSIPLEAYHQPSHLTEPYGETDGCPNVDTNTGGPNADVLDEDAFDQAHAAERVDSSSKLIVFIL